MGMFKKQVGLLAVVATLGIAGCATTQQLEEVKGTADKAASDAASAQADAAEALRVANEAKAEAAEAKRMARDALRSAEETDAKVDRMFKKAMHK